jgi:plastocyanin
VFVYVKSGLDAMTFPAGDAEVLDQEGCEYKPHVVALMTGQQLTVRNSDDVLHNVNATPSENRGFNRSQPQAGMEFETSFSAPEVMIPVRCDVHGWMESYIGVTDHPFHGVTGDDGSFTLADLPPGEYEVEAWHEEYGTSTQMVTVPVSGEVEITFEFSEQMAGRVVPMAPALVVDHATGTLRRAAPAAAGRQ